MEEIHYAYWLTSATEASYTTGMKLLEYAGSFRAIWEMSEKELADPALGLSEAKIRSMTSTRDEERIMRSYDRMLSDGIAFYHLRHPGYPGRLKHIYDAPLGIYVKGSLPDPDICCVAMVGARNCSEYGAASARRISSCLAEAGFQIISGLARGIDGISQRAALDAGGYSCAVLGCGPDICYPSENRMTYDELAEKGGIVSEFPPATPPVSSNFPRRNRIISGMSDICVVIEARERSGSLITADLALDQGRDVYAMPGRICDSLSHGTNRLIKQGAGIILSPVEFVSELAETIAGTTTAVTKQYHQMSIRECMGMTPEEILVYNATGPDPMGTDAIQDATGLDTGALMKSLISLSVRGLILQDQGYYVRNT